MPYILFPGESSNRSELGGKAAALAALHVARLPIPAWFVVTPRAFEASLTSRQQAAPHAAGQADDPEALEAALSTVQPREDVRAELARAVARLCPNGELVAVRSSALDEDGAQASFAGQLESYLFVRAADVADRVADVWRSGFGERALAYRRQQGLVGPPSVPAVLVQRMVYAASAGVAFSADPVSGRRGVAVVSAVSGLGSALVSGESDADTYVIDRQGTLCSRQIAEKRIAHQSAPETLTGVQSVAVPDEQACQPALTDEQARVVAELARRCERHFGCPQDVEWALADGEVYLLQSRPITSLAGLADPDGLYLLWDNSNIAESYGGVTTPLTFSFARAVYEQVYRQLCRVLGVSEAVIAAHYDTFQRMLGLVRGRVYYNLLNWYRLLALAPGFTSNRRFMEQMMGVKEGLPESIIAELGQATWRARMRDRLRLISTVSNLLLGYRRLPRNIAEFYERVDSALATDGLDLTRMRPDELVAYYRTLERQLVTHWDAPLVNDLFAMMFYGTLRGLASSWCADPSGSLQNDLLTGGGGIVSAEPAARVRKMAGIAAAHPPLVTALCDGSLSEIEALIETVPAFDAAYAAYLEKFADRCLEELKLESPTLRDDPMPLLRSVGHLAQRFQTQAAVRPDSETFDAGLRARAERRVYAALARHPLRRTVFGWVLANARRRVRDRENLRFERTRVFGRVRAIFVELGRRLWALGLLDEPRDIFYLEVEEALGFVVGTATTTDLKGLVALRQAEYARFRAEDAPPDRFETRGIVSVGQVSRRESLPDDGGDRRTGIGCCPGIVRGPVRLVRDPKAAEVRRGEVLVAERTDPGWIMLFPAAAGVLVERGSLLSHSAIVAREMGIPTIVSLSGLTHWLRDGDWVEMDGGTGVVSKIAAPAAGGSHA